MTNVRGGHVDSRLRAQVAMRHRLCWSLSVVCTASCRLSSSTANKKLYVAPEVSFIEGTGVRAPVEEDF